MSGNNPAPNKIVEYHWTAADVGRASSSPPPRPANLAPDKPWPQYTYSVSPYGVNPKDARLVKDLGSGTDKALSALKDGDRILLPLNYSNGWFPFRSTRFFSDTLGWEKPSGIKGKTIGDLCQALHDSDPARYPHYDLRKTKKADEGWLIFDYWEHTAFRWAFQKSGKLDLGMDPFSIPSEIEHPTEKGRKLTLFWFRYALPRTYKAIVAPSRKDAPEGEKKRNVVVVPVSLDKDSWRFELVKDKIVATAVGQAKYADLADGSLGTGIAKTGTEVDLTDFFPDWVKKALTAQVKTGFVADQPTLTEPPVKFQELGLDLGEGNCHGFTSKLFKLFDDLAFTKWTDATGSGFSNPDTTTPPNGAPSKIGDTDPRRITVNMLSHPNDVDTALALQADKQKRDQHATSVWVAQVSLGMNVLKSKLAAAGATELAQGAIPAFGDLGIRAHKIEDHSLIALGVAGGDRQQIYAIQKMGSSEPYAVYTRKVSGFRWYHRPNLLSRSKGGGK